MTKSKLEQLCAAVKELDEKATPSPWQACRDVNTFEIFNLDGNEIAILNIKNDENKFPWSDAELIINYRTAAPKLAMACEVLIKVLQNSRQSWNEVCELSDCAGSAIEGIDKALAEIEALLKEEKP